MHMYVYIYIYRERERERETSLGGHGERLRRAAALLAEPASVASRDPRSGLNPHLQTTMSQICCHVLGWGQHYARVPSFESTVA